LKGIVVPVEWADSGRVVAAAISSHDESEYLIEADQNGRELTGCLQKEVEVTGIISTKKEQKVILVNSFLSDETT